MLVGPAVPAQPARLELELPRAEWLLAPASAPQLRTEGTPLFSESLVADELLPLLQMQEFEAALELLREHYEDLLALLESGDPDELVNGRVIAMGAPGAGGGGRVTSAMLYLIGHTYLSLEQFLPAETALLRALVPMPDYLRVHESLGLLYLRTERFDEARMHLVRAAELGLRTPNLFGALGYLNQEIDNYWGAAAAYQQAMMLQPENEQWQQGLLFSLAQTHQNDSALTLADQLLQTRPGDTNLWLIRAHSALETGEREEALASLETVIRLGELSVANLQVAATLHMQIGSTARAVTLLRAGFGRGLEFELIEQAMDWLEVNGDWEYLADLVTNLRADWDTLTAVQRSRLLSREGSIDLNAGDDAEARSVLEQALALDAGNADALMSLGAIHAGDRNYGQAEIYFQRASAYPSHQDNALISLAQIAIDQENFERALELLRDVASRNPAQTALRRNIDSLENLVLLQSEN